MVVIIISELVAPLSFTTSTGTVLLLSVVLDRSVLKPEKALENSSLITCQGLTELSLSDPPEAVLLSDELFIKENPTCARSVAVNK